MAKICFPARKGFAIQMKKKLVKKEGGIQVLSANRFVDCIWWLSFVNNSVFIKKLSLIFDCDSCRCTAFLRMNPNVFAQQSLIGANTLNPKTIPITEEYEISKNVLGLGISGKVVECYSLKNKKKYALKVFNIWTVFYIFAVLLTFFCVNLPTSTGFTW